MKQVDVTERIGELMLRRTWRAKARSEIFGWLVTRSVHPLSAYLTRLLESDQEEDGLVMLACQYANARDKYSKLIFALPFIALRVLWDERMREDPQPMDLFLNTVAGSFTQLIEWLPLEELASVMKLTYAVWSYPGSLQEVVADLMKRYPIKDDSYETRQDFLWAVTQEAHLPRYSVDHMIDEINEYEQARGWSKIEEAIDLAAAVVYAAPISSDEPSSTTVLRAKARQMFQQMLAEMDVDTFRSFVMLCFAKWTQPDSQRQWLRNICRNAIAKKGGAVC